MKTIFYKSVLMAALGAGMLTSCVNDDDYDVPSLNCEETALVKTMEPQDVPASATAQPFEGNGVIEAYVTSSDLGGNFYKSISFQTLDGSFGFSVPVDVVDYFTQFEPGRKVLIDLNGTYTDVVNGSMRIGALYEGQVGRISPTEFDNVLNRSCTIVSEEDLVQDLTIAQAKSDARINTLIELQNVQFTEDAVGGTYYDENNVLGGATNLYLEDENGNTIIFRTSSFANYAGSEVPSGSGTVRGVLTKFNQDYQFVARTEEDIQLDQPRIGGDITGPGTPFFTEDFESAVDNTDFDFPGWYNIVESGSRKWSEQSYTDPDTGVFNGYAEFSSFNSGNAVNEAWLVTPAIDMDANSNVTMTFETAQHHLDGDVDGNKLEVFVLTSFDGTNITSATMVDITDQVNLPNSSTPWYDFVSSGLVNLSGYTGQIYIAFKFTGSGTNTNLDGAFQIDNLVFSGN